MQDTVAIEQLVLGLHHGRDIGRTDRAIVKDRLARDLPCFRHRQATQVLDQHLERTPVGLDGFPRVCAHPLMRDFLNDLLPLSAIGQRQSAAA